MVYVTQTYTGKRRTLIQVLHPLNAYAKSYCCLLMLISLFMEVNLNAYTGRKSHWVCISVPHGWWNIRFSDAHLWKSPNHRLHSLWVYIIIYCIRIVSLNLVYFRLFITSGLLSSAITIDPQVFAIGCKAKRLTIQMQCIDSKWM